MNLHISRSKVFATLQQFTLSFVCSIIVMILAIRGNHNTLITEQERFPKILLTIGVFAPLLISTEWLSLLKGSSRLRLMGSLKTIILAALYYIFRLPDMQSIINTDGYMLQIVIHFLITRGSLLRIVPVYMKRQAQDTRMHAYKLIINTITTIVFSAVLFGGLAAALGAIDYLFGVNIVSERYFDLRIIIATGFGILFRLSHLSVFPVSYTYTPQTFPKVLRVFSEYILGFLLIIYAGILFAYSFKILASGERPHGMVAMLIFGFVGMGMVYSAILLPRTMESPRLRIHSRILGLCFVGFSVLLRAALQQRVMEYGRTVERVLIILIAVRILLLACSLLLAKPSLKRRIISGTGLAILAIHAPVNIFSIAQDNQTQILQDYLAKIPDSTTPEAKKETESKISNIVDYLLRYHGSQALAPLVSSPDVLTLTGDNAKYPSTRTLGEKIVSNRGLSYQPYGRYDEGNDTVRYVSFNATYPHSLSLQGYSSLIFIDSNLQVQKQEMYSTGVFTTGYQIDFQNTDLSIPDQNLKISLLPFLQQAKDTNLPQQIGEPLLMTGDSFSLYIISLSGKHTKKDGTEIPSLDYIQGLLLLR